MAFTSPRAGRVGGRRAVLVHPHHRESHEPHYDYRVEWDTGRAGEPPVTIREVVESDRADWVRLRDALWPGSLSDHHAETTAYFEKRVKPPIIFVAEAEGRLVGFLELEYRPYAPGCRSAPVPFIEGWYVEPGVQRRGIGRGLIRAAERWARAAGHHEMASDADLENADAIAAHAALGYREVERVVCFRKVLGTPEEMP